MSAADLTLLPPETRVNGPSALGSDPRRLFQLTYALAITDFKLKFFGSALGYLWQLMRPLMLFSVLYVVFSTFFEVGDGVEYFPVSLLMGIVTFSFLAEATSTSVRSLQNRENLVRKIEFPRLAVPMASVLTALFNYALNLVPVIVFLLAAGGRPRWSWVQMPFLIGLLTLLALGLAMLLSALYIRYRDVEPIWDVVLQLLFYGTPILYTLQLLQEKSSSTVMHLVMISPFASVLEQMRHAVVSPTYLSASEGLGGTVNLLLPLLVVVVIVALGYRVFSKAAPRVAEEL